jgi:hypothetical protein
LLDFLRGLQTDAAFRSAFSANPEATIVEHGLGGLSPDDIHDALVLVEDNETADFGNGYAAAAGAHLAPPPAHGGEEQEAAQYLSSYLATTFPGADVPIADGWSTEGADPDFDVGPAFSSGSSDPGDGDGPGTDAHDVIGFGQGSSIPPAGADLDSGIDTDPGPGLDVGYEVPGHLDDAFGGGAEAFDEAALDDTGPLVSGAGGVSEPDHAGGDSPDAPPHPID